MDLSIKTKRATMAFYLYFLMMNFAKGLAMDGQSRTYNIIFLCSLVFLAIKLVYTKYTKGETIAMLVLVLLGTFFALHARENTPLFAILAIIGMKDIDFYDLMKKTLYVRIVSVILTRLACEYGILNEVDLMKPSPDGTLCHTWGYNDPNTLMVNIFIVLALLLYVNYERLNGFYFMGTMLFMHFVFKQSYSKTGYLLFILLWFIIICDKVIHIQWIRRLAYQLLSWMPLLITLATFVFGLGYRHSNPLMEMINQALTGRLFVINHYVNKFPCTLFGNSHAFWLKNAGEILAIVDNLYVTIYLYCGVFSLVLYVWALCVSLRKLVRMGYFPETIIVSVISIYAFMEEFPLNPIVNPFGVLLAMALFQTNIPRRLAEKECLQENVESCLGELG